MDFFAHQDQARRNTKWLVAYFILAIVLMILAIYLVFALAFLRHGYQPDTLVWLWNAKLFAGVGLGTLLVVLFGSAFKTMALRQGGGAVAMQLGGVPLDPNTRDPDHRRLLNVVEEMALAAGTAVPEVYVLSQEQGINAFAAGHQSQDAAIGVTQGCVKLLNRDELQGVIAHEFSHILNGDMRLNLRLMGLVHGILCIAILGRVLLRTGYGGRVRLGARDRGKGGNPLPLIGLGLLVIGSIGVFFGRLIKSAVSRQREFLADAAAVQFTRNPAGLAGALKKIGGLVFGSRLETPNAEEASHFFFSNGMGDPWLALMATHPPLSERIRLLDPAFDGAYMRVAVVEGPPAIPQAALLGGRPPHLYDLTEQGAAPALAAPVTPGQIIPRVGAPTPGHLQYAAELRAALPPGLVEAAREPMSAIALVYALLLSPAPEIRATQIKKVQEEGEPGINRELQRLMPELEPLPAEAKLPLALLSVPALGRLSVAQYEQFCRLLENLIACDQQVDLFEFTLEKIVMRRLEPHYRPAARPVIQYYSLKPLLPDCAVLLSALARVGTDDPGAAQEAFEQSAQRLCGNQAILPFLDFSRCGIEQLDSALDRLAQSVPAIKKRVLEACAYTVAADGLIQGGEAELLRAIAETLDCPIPPFIEGI